MEPVWNPHPPLSTGQSASYTSAHVRTAVEDFFKKNLALATADPLRNVVNLVTSVEDKPNTKTGSLCGWVFYYKAMKQGSIL